MVLVQLTLSKIIIPDLTFVLDYQLQSAKTAKSILPEFHMRHGYWKNLVYFKLCQIY